MPRADGGHGPTGATGRRGPRADGGHGPTRATGTKGRLGATELQDDGQTGLQNYFSNLYCIKLFSILFSIILVSHDKI